MLPRPQGWMRLWHKGLRRAASWMEQAWRLPLPRGAFAAQMGTAFILCPETDADEVYRKALAGPAAFHTCMTDRVSGRPARCLQNRFTGLSGSVGISPVPDYPIAYDAGKALNKAARNCGKMVLALIGQVRGPSGVGYASKSAHEQTEGRIARGTLFYDVIARACRQLGSVGKRSFQTGLYVIQSWSLRRPVDAWRPVGRGVGDDIWIV
ncbi:hypothetical protein MSKU3_0485 [Komagataeibacter oboediens]|nr:hypothetical protein MSKU3_0485 [Komagataeibacter oboediens]